MEDTTTMPRLRHLVSLLTRSHWLPLRGCVLAVYNIPNREIQHSSRRSGSSVVSIAVLSKLHRTQITRMRYETRREQVGVWEWEKREEKRRRGEELLRIL